MELFICWSGARSRAMARIMERRLKEIVPGLEPFVSTQIEKGSLWSDELRTRLSVADAGLLCLTPESVESPWIHYEAGLLAASVSDEDREPRIYTYLLGLQPGDLTGPLRSYQSTVADRDDTEQLVKDMVKPAASPGPGDYERWWRRLRHDLDRIPPVSLQEVVPDFAGLFRSQTFNEPLMDCTDQRWLGRHSDARDVLRRLHEERSRVQAACRPAVAELYDELCRQVEGYAMDLKAYFLIEKKFDPGPDGRLEILPPGGGVAAERRRTDIRTRVAQLLDTAAAPLMEESPRFELAETFAEQKALIHRKTAEIDNARPPRTPKIAQEELERAASSEWDFDRIVSYLVMERRADVTIDAALYAVTRELEKVRAKAGPRASHTALHYALGPLKRALKDQAVARPRVAHVKRVLCDVQRQLRGHDTGGQMALTVAEIRELLSAAGDSEPDGTESA